MAFVLTNGGRGFVSMEKVLENADNPKGFWLDLASVIPANHGLGGGTGSKGSVR